MAVGSAVSLRLTPGVKLRSGLQHLASGIVFAAVATELVPEMIQGRRIVAMLCGFAAGVLLMMLIRNLDPAREGKSRGVVGLLGSTAVDLLVDGFLVGIGFGLVRASGVLLVVAITFEVLFIGLSISVSLVGRGMARSRSLVVLCLLALLVPIGAVIGTLLFGVLDEAWKVAAISFGSAALLYLVTEELLVEAHEQGDTSIGSTMFFVGFGLSLLLAMIAGH
jgi:ZIP family zinc transporter